MKITQTILKLACAISIAMFAFATVAQADGVWRRGSEQDDAGSRSKTCGTTLDPGEICFHTYTAADTNSDPIRVRNGASLCVDPDITTNGTATATFYLWRIVGDKGVSWSVNTGVIVTNTLLTGAHNVDPQLACIYDIPPGIYVVESVTAPGGQDVVVEFAAHGRQ